MSIKQRYLILSYFYAPVTSARAFRWASLAEYWAGQGHQVDVVCAWEPGLERQETRNGVNVYRVNADLQERIRSFYKRGNSAPSKIQSQQSDSRGGGRQIRSFLRWFFFKVYLPLQWPDGGFLWRSPALRQARDLVQKMPYDALISVSPHFTAHLVGLDLCRDLPHLHWLVDNGDPFWFRDIEPPNNQQLYRRLNRRAERNVFQRAKVITVTTRQTQAIYATHFPESASKLSVIPPLLSPLNREDSSEPFFPQDDKLRLVFAGQMYGAVRRPEFLLRLFSALLKTPLGARLELHFIGNVSLSSDAFQTYPELLDKKIFLHGSVSRSRAMQAMREAAVLVNVGNKTSYQLPSKVVEYASLGKPILNLAHILHDSSSEFFSAYPAALCLTDEDESGVPTEAHLHAVYQFISSPPPPIDAAWLRNWLQPYQLESISAAYQQLLFQVSSSNTTP